jgi:hypothetical protein
MKLLLPLEEPASDSGELFITPNFLEGLSAMPSGFVRASGIKES